MSQKLQTRAATLSLMLALALALFSSSGAYAQTEPPETPPPAQQQPAAARPSAWQVWNPAYWWRRFNAAPPAGSPAATANPWGRGSVPPTGPQPPPGAPAQSSAAARPPVDDGRVLVAAGPNSPALNVAGENLLREVTTDISERARAGRYRPFTGDPADLIRFNEALSRPTTGASNAAVFVLGERGARNALLEAAAVNARIVSLDVTRLVAGTNERGQLERKLNALVEVLHRHPEMHIVIDGAQSLTDYPVILQRLIPELESGAIRGVLAFTSDDFREFAFKNAGFAHSAQPLRIATPGDEQILTTLRTSRDDLERRYHVQVTDDAMREAVRLARRYYAESAVGSRATQLLETSMARWNTEQRYGPLAIATLDGQIQSSRLEVQSLELDLQRHPDDASVRDRLQIARSLLASRSEAAAIERERPRERSAFVGPRQVQEVVGFEMGESAERIGRSDAEIMRQFEQDTRRQIIGQDHILKTLADRLSIHIDNTEPPTSRPIASYVFAGPTGVGKTESALALSRALGWPLLHLNMNEYSAEHSVSRLWGAPPGYAGFEEGGVLTNAVMDRPQHVILFDEIEKAHPSLFTALMQVQDRGVMQDGRGRDVNFKNTILIMTTNLGTDYVQRYRGSQPEQIAAAEREYGFTPGELARLSQDERDQTVLKRLLRQAGVPDAVLNRFDRILPANPITMEAATRITQNRLDEIVRHNRAENRRNIVLAPGLAEACTRAGLDPEYGARPLRRSVTTLVSDLVARSYISGAVGPRQPIYLSFDARNGDGGAILARASVDGPVIGRSEVNYRAPIALGRPLGPTMTGHPTSPVPPLPPGTALDPDGISPATREYVRSLQEGYAQRFGSPAAGEEESSRTGAPRPRIPLAPPRARR